MLYRRRHSAKVAVLLAVIGLALMPALTVKAQPPVRIAVYSQHTPFGASLQSQGALKAMFEWMGAEVTDVYAADILTEGFLTTANFDVLVMPGGYAVYYKIALGMDGVLNIRDFVSSGGGYIGVCAGAYFATEQFWWFGKYFDYDGTILGLFPGYGEGPVPELTPVFPEPPRPVDAGFLADRCFNKKVTTRIDLVKGHPITDSLPEDYLTIMYWGGPMFEEVEGVDVIGTYFAHEDAPAMVAFEYGSGKVFLTGPHPEFEEESDIDGQIFDNYLYDPESEWPLMQNVVEWLTS